MDYLVGDTLYFMFTTRAFATGIPTVLAGTPVVSAYEDDSATQITAGITLGADHDSVVGMNLLTIVATGANGYEAGKDYNLVITTGTVGGVSVVGEVVGTFSLGRSAAAQDLANATDGLGALKTLLDAIPTTAMRGTDNAALASEVTAARMATLTDWIDGGRLDLLLDAIPTTAMRGTDDAALASEVTAARMATLTDWIDGGRLDLLLDAIPTTAMRGTDSALTDKAGFSLSTAGILAVWHQALTAVVTAGSVGKLLKDEITSARMAVLADWINGGRLDLLLDAIPTTAMRGTDSAALASEVTAARMATLTDWIDGGRLDLLLDAIPTTAMRGTDSAALASEVTAARMATLTDWIDGGRLDLLLDDVLARIPAALVSGKMDSDATSISGDSVAADRLEGLMDGILLVQVADASATTTAFAADGFTEASDDHFLGRLITFVTGALTGQQTDITDYDAAGHAQGSQAFVVTALTEAPADNDWFVIH